MPVVAPIREDGAVVTRVVVVGGQTGARDSQEEHERQGR